MTVIMLLDMASITVEALSSSYFTASSQTVYPGNSTTITVSANNLEGLASVELEIYYDSTVMSVNSTWYGSLIGDSIANVNASTPGIVKLSAISRDGISGSGSFLNIDFTVNSDCPRDDYSVLVTVGEAYDTNLKPVEMSGGTGYITVKQKEIVKNTFYLYSNISPYSVSKGDTVTYRLYNSYGYQFAAGNFEINYDSELLQVESVNINSNLKVDGCVYDVNTTQPGKIKIGIASNVELYSYELIFSSNSLKISNTLFNPLVEENGY